MEKEAEDALYDADNTYGIDKELRKNNIFLGACEPRDMKEQYAHVEESSCYVDHTGEECSS